MEVCNRDGHIEHQNLVELAMEMRAEVFADNLNQETRIVLQQCQFSTRWTHRLVKRHRGYLANALSRPVDAVRDQAFNAFNVAQFFAQAKFLYDRLNISTPE